MAGQYLWTVPTIAGLGRIAPAQNLRYTVVRFDKAHRRNVGKKVPPGIRAVLFLPASHRCASINLMTVYRKFWAGAIHPQPSLLGTVHKCCPGILFNHTKMKKLCTRPGQNRVFTAYQVRGLLQNRQRRRKEVHKMFTFQAGQNRVFAAYQVREKFFWDSISVFRLLCNSGIMRDFIKGGEK